MTKERSFDQSILVVPRATTDERRMDLRELFESHAAYVWNSLRRLGVPARDLEDVLQDVFLQVQKHLGDYDTTRPVRPWLFGFAFRVASQYRRRAHRWREAPAEARTAVDPELPADEQLAAEQDRRLVLAALDCVDLDKRAVFVLREIDGTPMNDIAESLGIPVNTAYSRLRAARADFTAAVKRLRLQRGER